MRIVVHHNKFFDWEPVPADVKITDEDVKAGRVKPTRHGAYLMKVTKSLPDGELTHTQINIPEHQVVAKIIHQRLRPDGGATLTRKEAVAHYLAENVMPHHAKRQWFKKFEVHDSGPEKELAHSMFKEHEMSKQLDYEDLQDCMDAYLEETSAQQHVEHLLAHFQVKK